MAEVKQWITINGKHVPIMEGETKADAVKKVQQRQIQDDEDRKEKQIQKQKSDSLENIEDVKELQKEMHRMFIEEGSYVNDPEFQKLSKEYTDASHESGELHDKQMELYDLIKKETVVDQDILKEFGGDKTLARMFSEKTEKGKAAEKELESVNTRQKEATRRREELESKINALEAKHSVKQKEAFDKRTSGTVKPADFKDNFDGFETNTHISEYQDLIKSGEAKLVKMSPKEYLEYCAYKIFPDSTYEKQVRVAIGDAKSTMDLVKLMKNGTKMYTPVLDFKAKEQEGRHRAVAAMILGIDEIPVVVRTSR